MLRLIQPTETTDPTGGADETRIDVQPPADYEQKIRAQQARADACHAAPAAIRPSWAKALIVAELEQDQCDSMTDYFATRTERVVALAWSAHTRDLFSE